MVCCRKILCGIIVMLALCRASAQKPHGDGFQISCDACHTSESWTVITDSVSFDHDTTTFSLDGRHESVDCRQCHSTLEFAKAESNCTACHLDIHQQSVGDQCARCHDYNQTNEPDHQAAQFPTTCETCHSQSAWEPATWDHDNLYFPIYSGSDENAWDQCTDCHSNPNNYSIFTCLTCHQQGETNQDHQGVNGYQYESNACLACHPEGD